MNRGLLIVFCSLGAFLSVSCDSEELLGEPEVYGTWEWVRTYQSGWTGRQIITPETAGYNLTMIIGPSDTIRHYRNDTLQALSIIKRRALFTDRIELYHEFVDSVNVGNGMEPVVVWSEDITYSQDSIWSASSSMMDFFSSKVYSRKR